MRKLISVFVSSTSQDLQPYRAAVIRRLRACGDVDVVGMEDFPADVDPPALADRKHLAVCDLYVGILGPLYGSTEKDQEGETSFTEREYDDATQQGKPRLIFLADDDFPVPLRLSDSEPEWKRRKKKEFHHRVPKEHIVKTFLTADGLASDVLAAFHNWQQRTQRHVQEADEPGQIQPSDPVLDAYKAWAREKASGIDLIGLGGNDLSLSLDEVYVPLRIADRGGFDGDAEGSLALEDIFRAAPEAAGSVLILGEPGAGKTTALRKLAHVCLGAGDHQGPRALGLPLDTVPVFLRLRRFTGTLLADTEPVARLLAAELADQAGAALADTDGLSRQLWDRGGLLLLCDGLDEIADESLRASVARCLAHAGDDWRRRGIRAAVSCRRAGYDGETVRLGDGFRLLEVQPLDDGLQRDLVYKWFRRAFPKLERGGVAEADRDAAALLEALKAASYGVRQVRWLVATPLMLTLLCLVVLRGGVIPQRRVDFYEECLEVLLQRWDKERVPPLLDLSQAVAVLRRLAWHLHTQGLRDELTDLDAVDLIEAQLPDRDGFAVLAWLYQRTGVLVEVQERHYGFRHLGFQEYLAARHIAAEGGDLIPELAAKAGDDWWVEVTLLLAGRAERRLFATLAEALLNALDRPGCPELLRQALQEAAEPDLDPFLDRLRPGGDAAVQETVLRLLIGQSDERLRAVAAALTQAPGTPTRVAALAAQYLHAGTESAGKPYDFLLVADARDRNQADGLRRQLARRGLRLVADDPSWLDDIRDLRSKVRAVVILAGAKPPWTDARTQRGLSILDRAGVPLVPVLLPDADRTEALPDLLLDARVLSWTETLDADLCAALDAGSGKGAISGPLTEPKTGLRLLPIPAGTFLMGAENLGMGSRPVHVVRLSAFWLGETPVTNAQYQVFLEAAGHREPKYWRDRRFCDPNQPVVGVDWHDAVAFCNWLSIESEIRCSLPSEAQWEYAARGPDSWPYPWGVAPPTPERACYGQDRETGRPAPVGATPAGRGPFGTLDQAGSVWEWCADVWSGDVYAGRSADLVVNPVNNIGDGNMRSLRGGSWIYGPGDMHAAGRDWRHASNRSGGHVGFRVCAAPASTVDP